ncbi:MAG: DUF3168 domain-containing protein [Alphaproteobacteria bacterium]|nr:DUF3168 domain-containing protein [Alphaproteobacteria bacterium]
MADINEALFNRLSNFAGLSALVAARIYPVVAPPSPTFGLVTYTKISGARVNSLSGASGLARPRFQIDSYSIISMTEARAIAKQVRLALDGWRGTYSGVKVGQCLLDNERDLTELDNEPRLFRVSQDYLIHHTE